MYNEQSKIEFSQFLFKWRYLLGPNYENIGVKNFLYSMIVKLRYLIAPLDAKTQNINIDIQ